MKMMKFISSVISAITVIILSFLPSDAEAQDPSLTVNWAESGCEILDVFGNPLTQGTIMLISTGPNGVIDHPDVDGVGGDYMLLAVASGDANPNSINPLYLGSSCIQQFSYNTEFSNLSNGDVIYLRAFDGDSVSTSSYYGDSPTDVVSGLGSTGYTFDATPSGPWYVNNTITPVKLTYFRALDFGGGVLLEWETGSEIGNAGFRILRADNPEGPFTDVTGVLIPSRAFDPEGARYAFIDWNVEPGKTYYYLLEDMPYDGTPSYYGFASSDVTSPEVPLIEVQTYEDGAIVTFTLRGVDIDIWQWGHKVVIPGFEYLEEPGGYRLPYTQLDMGVAPQGDVHIELLDSDTAELYALTMTPYVPFVPQDPAVESDFSPSTPAGIAAPVVIAGVDTVRGQRVAHIIIVPVEYDESSDVAFLYTRMQFRVTWTPQGASQRDPGYESVFKKLTNYRTVTSMRKSRGVYTLNLPDRAIRVRTGEKRPYRLSYSWVSSRLNLSEGDSVVIEGKGGQQNYLRDGDNIIFLGGEGDGFYTTVSSFLLKAGTPVSGVRVIDATPRTGTSLKSQVTCRSKISSSEFYMSSLPHLPPEKKWAWIKLYSGRQQTPT